MPCKAEFGGIAKKSVTTQVPPPDLTINMHSRQLPNELNPTFPLGMTIVPKD